jgi:diguanylate cyclase (GGDEF)-like protein
MESSEKKRLVSPLRQVNYDMSDPPAITLKQRWMRDVKEMFNRGDWLALEQKLSKAWDNTTIDELTGLGNRRMFFKYIEKVVQPRMRRLAANSPLGVEVNFGSIVYIDMDDFKQINTRFGHAGGDEVLRVFGQMLEQHFRLDDVIGRMGGDEFVVVAVGLSRRDVKQRMHAFKKEFESYQWELCSEEDNVPYDISFSFDVARIENPDQFAEQIHKADKNVLRQKENRRKVATDL